MNDLSLETFDILSDRFHNRVVMTGLLKPLLKIRYLETKNLRNIYP